MSCYECKYCIVKPVSTEIDGIEVLNPVCTYHGDGECSQDIVWANDGYCGAFESARSKTSKED